ncbi:YiiX/YebB-like N1pC/P60 family cysteine hydrolase [Pilimelia columellifera]|uniref:Permuted papain-like amidase enzyme, YaeF/YiiX, C92 family n=1 Tax=Pilimelia columellifera subsp. columellifera TaxID=706583 RepID=A0ABN3NTM2_9ACTN
MQLNVKIAIGLAATCAAAALVGAPAYASSASQADPVAELLAMMPAVDPAEFRAELADLAAEENSTVEALAEQMLAEAKPQDVDPGTDIVRDVPVHNARHKGDVFYTDAKTGGVNHGHVGFYGANRDVIEAHSSSGVRHVPQTQVRVKAGSARALESKNNGARNGAADYAGRHVGKKYDMDFVSNKGKNEEGSFNCSELVWRGFKSQGIDVDKDGGRGVYPRDVRDDNDFNTYDKY